MARFWFAVPDQALMLWYSTMTAQHHVSFRWLRVAVPRTGPRANQPPPDN
jgi:hypothetical protein